MPYRRIPIIKGEVYHVFNRSVAQQPIFIRPKDYQRMMELIWFYSHVKPDLRYSHYNRLPLDQKFQFSDNLTRNGKKQIELFSFCLMPNHFHFLVREKEDIGISNFMRNLQNGYARYFNIKNDRIGALFQMMFKAVRIESDEQLIHVCRYIHLNPLTGYILKNAKELESYRWSSFPEYLKKDDSLLIDKNLVLSFFSSIEDFKQFTFDQVDYQRELDKIKHLVVE